jgi:hypothetical protein
VNKRALIIAFVVGFWANLCTVQAQIGDPVRNNARQALTSLGLEFDMNDVCRAAQAGNLVVLQNYVDAGMDFKIYPTGRNRACHDSAYQVALKAGHAQAALLIENAGGKTEPGPKLEPWPEPTPPTALSSAKSALESAIGITILHTVAYLAWVVNFFLVIPILFTSFKLMYKPAKQSTFWTVVLVCGICLAPSYFGGSHDVMPFPGIFPFAVWFAKPTTDWWTFSVSSVAANTALMYFAFSWLQRRAARKAAPRQFSSD